MFNARIISVPPKNTAESRGHTQLVKIKYFILKICSLIFTPARCRISEYLDVVTCTVSLDPGFYFISFCFEVYVGVVFLSKICPPGFRSKEGLSCCCQSARCPLIKVTSQTSFYDYVFYISRVCSAICSLLHLQNMSCILLL